LTSLLPPKHCQLIFELARSPIPSAFSHSSAAVGKVNVSILKPRFIFAFMAFNNNKVILNILDARITPKESDYRYSCMLYVEAHDEDALEQMKHLSADSFGPQR